VHRSGSPVHEIFMRRDLESVLDAVRTLPAMDLPRLLGDIEEGRATALARLSAPPVPIESSVDRNSDDLLDVDAAASYIGMSSKWIYRHSAIMPVVRIGFGTRPRLRFRRRDLDGWLEQRKISKYR
jgi:hypothetical protein